MPSNAQHRYVWDTFLTLRGNLATGNLAAYQEHLKSIPPKLAPHVITCALNYTLAIEAAGADSPDSPTDGPTENQ